MTELVGLVPAAGRAARLGRLPCSKEVLPVGTTADGRPKPIAEYLLERLAAAGAARAYVVLRAGKWDVPAYFGDGRELGLPLAYLSLDESGSVAETLDRAYPFVRGARVAVGFPDILFEPADAFSRAAERQRASGADAVLALVPTDRPDKADVVTADADGRVRRIEIKPPAAPAGGGARFTWIAAVWGPAITELLHRRLAETGGRAPGGGELYPGHVLQEAVDRGLVVEALSFPEGRHLDVGTPEDLARAVRPGA